MNIFAQWIKDVVIVSVLSAIASSLCGNMTSAKKAIPIITTASLLIVTVIPLKSVDIDDIFEYMDNFEYSVSEYESSADELTKAVTEEKLSEYVCRRLRENGAECEVQIFAEMTEDGYYAPKQIDIRGGDADEEKRTQLSGLIMEELSCTKLYWDGVRYVYEY